ncbi:MAG: hypothetical protein ABIO44_13515 [Saprospiraceae bacterium]
MQNKKYFLQNEYISLLKTLEPNAKGLWGLMNAHQMVEHMTYAFQLGDGKVKVDQLISPEENIPKFQDWILTNKAMKINIQNPLISSNPQDLKHSNYFDSIEELEQEILDFFKVYSSNPNLSLLNPFFGSLNEELNTNLLFKHSIHHLKQFGIEVDYVEG